MQSPHASLGRRRRSDNVLFAALLTFLACACVMSCADGAARIGEPSAGAANPARTPAPASPPVATDAAAPEAPSINIAGRVVDDLETAVIGRPITLVDHRGKRLEILTDEEGFFHMDGVTPPYDVVVAPAPSGAVITPLVYFGLNRVDPRLEVFEREGPTPLPQSQPIRVAVRLPPCRATSGACWVSVVSASPSGGGGTAGSYTDGTETAIYDVEHSWREPTTRPGEAIDLHVLVGDAQYTEYAYTRLLHIAARPGEATDVGTVAPAPVEATDPVSVAGHATEQPDGWEWTLASQLDLPGGATFALRYDWAAASSMRLPKLPSATWHVGAWVQHPETPEEPYFHRSSQAWSGTLPLTAAIVSLDVPMAPEPLRPTLEGSLSRRGIGLAWDGRSPALAAVVVVDLAHGEQRFRAFTSDAALSLRRLEALGLSRLETGDHVLDLTTTPGANVDELTQPDAAKRKLRFDPSIPGATTYQRYRFTVTR